MKIKKARPKKTLQERYPRICKNCRQPEWSHIGKKCLFDARTEFDPGELQEYRYYDRHWNLAGTITGRMSSGVLSTPRGMTSAEKRAHNKFLHNMRKEDLRGFIKDRNKPERKYR